MNIATRNGDLTFSSWPEAEEFLCSCETEVPDDLWLSGDTEYPCLAIMVNGRFACVHYFLNNNGDMWQSVGCEERDITFSVGGEYTEMPANTVVPLEQAIACARQFFHSPAKPDCIEWRAL